jgi:hypothetical protein
MTDSSLDGPIAWGPRVYVASGLLSLLVLVVALVTTPKYGITSDEPVIHFGGEWQLWAMASEHPERWNFKKDPPAEFARTTHFNTHPDAVGHWVFPGFPAVFCAAVATLARRIPGYDAVDAVHAGLAVLHALALLALTLYLSRLFGLRRALLTGALLALFPCAVGHSHYNIKDWPAAEFYALTVVAFLVGAVENRARFIVQSGVWLGFGLASKANPAFALPTLVLFVPIGWRLLYREARKPSRATVAGTCLLPQIAAVTFYLAWPYLHSGTAKEQWDKLAEVVSFFLSRAGSQRDGFTDYPFLLASTMTPPILLMGLCAAAVLPFRAGRREAAAAALGWIWLAVPLGRIAWPRSNFYDGNRHFLEYIPALVFLSGSGLDLACAFLGRRLRVRFGERAAAFGERAMLVVVVAFALWPTVQYHPFESTYYNVFAGGLGGAQKGPLTKGYFEKMEWWGVDSEGDYWGFSYRGAMGEVNRVAEQGASFHPCGNLIGPLTRYQTARLDLRQAPRDEADYFIVIPRRPFCSEDDMRYIRERSEIITEERRDGGLVYGVYRRRAP